MRKMLGLDEAEKISISDWLKVGYRTERVKVCNSKKHRQERKRKKMQRRSR